MYFKICTAAASVKNRNALQSVGLCLCGCVLTDYAGKSKTLANSDAMKISRSVLPNLDVLGYAGLLVASIL